MGGDRGNKFNNRSRGGSYQQNNQNFRGGGRGQGGGRGGYNKNQNQGNQ